MMLKANSFAIVLVLAAAPACAEIPPPNLQGELTGNGGIDPMLPQGNSGGEPGTDSVSGGSDGANPSQGDLGDSEGGQTPKNSNADDHTPGGDHTPGEDQASGDDQTPGGDHTTDGDQTSDEGTTTGGDASTSGEDGNMNDGDDAGGDDTSTTSTACTDQNYSLYSACSGREYAKLVIEVGSANPCSTDPIDYCTLQDCLDDWAKDVDDARDACRSKYPLCGELWDEYWDIAVPDLGDTCTGRCTEAYQGCQYDHYCEVGGPDNADSMVLQACSQAHTDCVAACAPLPPGMPMPGVMFSPR